MSRTKPHRSNGGGRHEYSQAENLAYWQARWRADFAALTPAQQAERIAEIRARLATANRQSPLRDLARTLGIEVDE